MDVDDLRSTVDELQPDGARIREQGGVAGHATLPRAVMRALAASSDRGRVVQAEDRRA